MDEDSVLCILYEAPLKNILSEQLPEKLRDWYAFP